MSHLRKQLTRACGMARLLDDLKAVCQQFRYDSLSSLRPFIGSEVVGDKNDDRALVRVPASTKQH
jgi:hypothetical protein